MNCAVHPEVEASGYCRNCGKAMCSACARPVRDVLYCEECLAAVMGVPPAAAAASTATAAPAQGVLPAAPPAGGSAGNAGVAFILGFIPGLGAIYNGEYNKALVHIAAFAAIILGLNLDLGGGAEAVLICALVIFPFYMAIDALRTVKSRQSGEPYRDPLENWTKEKSIGPILLIGLGALFLFKNFGLFDFFRFRELFFPVLLIGFGLWLMRDRISRHF